MQPGPSRHDGAEEAGMPDPPGRPAGIGAPAPVTEDHPQARTEPVPARPEAAAPPAEEGSTPPGAAGEVDRKGRAKKDRGPLSFLKELPILLVVAFVLALLIKTFLVQAFYIPSASMENTLEIGDRVLVNKLVYRFHPPRRGDIIVFEEPHPATQPSRSPFSAFIHWLTEGLGVSTNPEKDFIKRVVGLPGETIEVDEGRVFIDGRRLDEPYLNPLKDLSGYGPTKVPADSLFVMGDNRANSNDSRRGLGFIPYDKVVGRAFVIIWPPSRVQWLHGL